MKKATKEQINKVLQKLNPEEKIKIQNVLKTPEATKVKKVIKLPEEKVKIQNVSKTPETTKVEKVIKPMVLKKQMVKTNKSTELEEIDKIYNAYQVVWKKLNPDKEFNKKIEDHNATSWKSMTTKLEKKYLSNPKKEKGKTPVTKEEKGKTPVIKEDLYSTYPDTSNVPISQVNEYKNALRSNPAYKDNYFFNRNK